MPIKFKLECPACGKKSETIKQRRKPTPRVHCGDCLMDRIDVVLMTIISDEEIEEQGNGV